MCAPSPPPAPDYAAAAREQGAANEQAAITQGHINNPNVISPYGSQNVTWNGNDPTLTQTLSPQEQAIYNANAGNRLDLGNLASQGIQSLRGLIGSGLDFSGMPGAGSALNPNGIGRPTALDPRGLPGMPSNLPEVQSAEATRQRVIDAMMGRANKDFAQREDQTNSDLIARGLRPGTEAYAREMQRIDQARNDAKQQAEIAGGNAASQQFEQDLQRRQQLYGEGMGIRQQAVGEQGQQFSQGGQLAQLIQSLQGQQFGQQDQLRRQAITELLAQRQTPLNEITALMSGSQVSNPFAVPGYAQNTQVAPAPIFGATQAQGAWDQNAYNQSVGGANNFLTGLFGLGSAFLGGRR